MADRPANIRFRSDGLVPAIVQQTRTGTVLMLVEMNQEALALTLQTGRVHVWSRTRQHVCEQPDKSGQVQQVVSVTSDADGESLLVQVNVASLTDAPPPFSLPVLGMTSTESEAATRPSPPVTEMLGALYDLIQVRRDGQDTSSYVYRLFQRGHDVMCKKVGEEAAEVIIASKNQVDDEVIYEMADLWFHATVLLGYHNIHPHDVLYELQRRFGQPGGGKEGYSAGEATPKPSVT